MLTASLTGWYVGFGVGGVVVIVVVILLAVILRLAHAIAVQAQAVTSALEDCRANTNALWDVEKVIASLKRSTAIAATARGLAESKLLEKQER